MKKLLIPVLCLVISGICSTVVDAQNNIINTAVGTGTPGYLGDGGPATAARISSNYGQCIWDGAGNMFFTDNNNHCIRKVSATGIISTIAGTGTLGFSGDGGPATAARMNSPQGLLIDPSGNMLFVDANNMRIRKIDPSGIISTFAGIGTAGIAGDGGPAISAVIRPNYLAMDVAGNLYFSNITYAAIRKINTAGIVTNFAGNGLLAGGFSGDGGPATAALLNDARGMVFDADGNMYFTDIGNRRVRKISPAGIITTFAGNGLSGTSGDGGPAIAASFGTLGTIAIDNAGNLYVADETEHRIRKIDNSGIITTVAGIGVAGATGDWGPATAAKINGPTAVDVDPFGNLFIVEKGGKRIRKVSNTPDIISDSFNVTISSPCSGVQLSIVAPSAATTLSVRTSFGDGITVTSTLASISALTKAALVTHTYANQGFYRIKQVLLNGTAAIDSVSYTYHSLLCNSLPLEFYYDVNSNCQKDEDEYFNYLPLTIAVDSNGVTLDTIAVGAGLGYTAYGNPGDVYAFRIIGTSPGMAISCPSSGVIYDTIQTSVYNRYTKRVGLSCTSTPGYDLSDFAYMKAGRHIAEGDMLVRNANCIPVGSMLTMNISPKYSFSSSYPPPTSVIGNTVNWDLGSVTSFSPQPYIRFTLELPTSTWLLPGDTVNTKYTANPTDSDIQPTDNVINKVDTVKSSYDPNEIVVTPEGNILSGKELQYTIHFENTGNDTAHNIYVMDTLSDYLDMNSFRFSNSSAPMHIIPIISGGHNYIKFDFPNIKLLDSSHHNQCTGMLTYTIKTLPGLPHGTLIHNHAGIYFDDNEAIITNTATNTILVPSVAIATSTTATICHTDAVSFTATATSIQTPHYQWTKNSSVVGIDNSTLLISGLASGDIISCRLMNAALDTTIATSDGITMSVDPTPVSTIGGATVLCEAAATTLTTSLSGGTWSSGSATIATVAGGVVSGHAPGIVSISYTLTNACGTGSGVQTMTVNPLPVAGTISGAANVCVAASSTLTSSIPGGAWYSGSVAVATVSGGIVSGVTPGVAPISYALTNGCGTTWSVHSMTVNPLPVAGAIAGAAAVCEAGTTLLIPTITGGTWSSGSPAIATVSGGGVTGIASGVVPISYAVTNMCGTAYAFHSMTINPLPVAGAISGAATVCEAGTTVLFPAISGGAWSSGSTGVATVSGGIVSGVTPGVAPISYAITNGCGTDWSIHTMTVNGLPSAASISGAADLCESTSITLTTTIAGGIWSTGSTSATVSGGIVTGISAGAATITYTVSNICGTALTTHAVTILAPPIAGSFSGLATVCESGTAILVPSVSGGSWTTSNTNATVSGGLVTGVAPGSVTISYTVSNICGSDVAVHDFDITPLPDAGTITGAATLCIGDTTLFSTSSVTPGTWNATIGNAMVIDGMVIGIASGTETISFNATNSCGTSTSVTNLTIEDCPLTIGATNPNQVWNVYPNPARDFIVISTPSSGTITLTNSLGQVILTQSLNAPESVVSLINVPTGIYLVRFIGSQASFTKKILIAE